MCVVLKRIGSFPKKLVGKRAQRTKVARWARYTVLNRAQQPENLDLGHEAP